MGRRKKYFTEEQLKNADIIKHKKYYNENKRELMYKSRLKYWNTKITQHINDGQHDIALAVRNKAIDKGMYDCDLIMV